MDLVCNVDDGLNEGLIPLADGAGEGWSWSVGGTGDQRTVGLVDELAWST